MFGGGLALGWYGPLSFGTIPPECVRDSDLGESCPDNPSDECTCAVQDSDGDCPSGTVKHSYGGGCVATTATVSKSAFIGLKAAVCGTARVLGNARVYGEAQVCGRAVVRDDARVFKEAHVFGNATVYGEGSVSGTARVFGSAKVL